MCSFLNVKQKWEPELHHYCPKVPIILVGTKKDLLDQTATENDKGYYNSEQLQYDQRALMANNIKAVGYWECSAKTGDGIDKLIEGIIDTAFGPRDEFANDNQHNDDNYIENNTNNNNNNNDNNGNKKIVKKKPVEAKPLLCHII